jgi:hypothetical protein
MGWVHRTISPASFILFSTSNPLPLSPFYLQFLFSAALEAEKLELQQINSEMQKKASKLIFREKVRKLQ